jgi:hypothetical protein
MILLSEDVENQTTTGGRVMKKMMKQSVGNIGAVSARVAIWFENQAQRVKGDKSGVAALDYVLMAGVLVAVVSAIVAWVPTGIIPILDAAKNYIVDIFTKP